jgi:acyl-CoA synthetase (AMP-forming)/AMP-acid ligase II
MRGYWRNDHATKDCIAIDGWFKTGDAGYLQDGFLFIHDRVKDMIISGGENIYPAEIENVLMSHSGISDVAVIGVPSERWGETVKAIITRKDLQMPNVHRLDGNYTSQSVWQDLENGAA